MRPSSGLALLAVVIGVTCLVSGCGGATSTSSSGAHLAGTSSLSYAGTLTVSDPAGSTMTERYSVGQPEYFPSGTLLSSVPEAVVKACNVDHAPIIAHTAFSPAELKLSDVRGGPLRVGFRGDELVDATVWDGTAAFEIDGQWRCDALDGGDVSLHAGQSLTVPIWILSAVINSASATLPQSLLDTWEFDPSAVAPDDSVSVKAGGIHVTASGPNAGDCGDLGVVMLYARAPTC